MSVHASSGPRTAYVETSRLQARSRRHRLAGGLARGVAWLVAAYLGGHLAASALLALAAR